MPKSSTQYVCQQCGSATPKWQGQCPQCGTWNSLVETAVMAKTGRGLGSKPGRVKTPIKLSQIKGKVLTRINTGISELDRVLGGGIVPGSVILLAGEPGIGKSTLITQLSLKIAKDSVYVCGEESPEQIKLRVDRLSVTKRSVPALSFLPETDTDSAIASVASLTPAPALIIVDSIQTMFTADLTGMAGSVGQIRESAYRWQRLAKEQGMTVILVGHVTKEGAIAGPKVLEHLVDTVLYLEGDKHHSFRILRGQKNRFGSVDEVGVFLMTDKGLEEVANPSDIFLEERQTNVAGSAIAVVMEGTRPMLVEIQALVIPSQLAVPRRVGSGIDMRRLQLLVAVLSKRLKLPLATYDVYVNVAGGLNLKEPAADLAICMAITSSFRNKATGPKTAVFGEVGLLGEVRRVGFADQRIKEAKKLGYSQIISPATSKNLSTLIK
ncbi:DNA repair protein RadA [Patescibacteria group bacterium]|nr:DNA repair protein RadA [Patescibacteria group bacterium]